MIAGLAACAVLVAACGSSSPSTSGTSTTGGGAAKGATITIKNFNFSPTSLTVAPGTTVSVTNDDSVAHTVTSTTHKFDTGNVEPGQTVTFKAPTATGTYAYICTIHQFMHGSLIVS